MTFREFHEKYHGAIILVIVMILGILVICTTGR